MPCRITYAVIMQQRKSKIIIRTPFDLQAMEKMASIYLHHRKDKKMYAQCYR